MAAVLPPNLALMVQRLANFNRQTIRVRPQSNDAVGSGQTMTFRMPTNTLVDLHNIHFFGECHVLSGTGAANPVFGFPESMQGCIERLDVVINGQVITLSNHDYGGLYTLLTKNLKTSHHQLKESTNEIERGGPRGFFNETSSSPTEGRQRLAEAAATVTAGSDYTVSYQSQWGSTGGAGTDFPFTITGLLGFLSGHYVRFIDTAVTGPMEIRIRLAPNWLLWRGKEDARLGSYQLKTQYGVDDTNEPDLQPADYEFRRMYMVLDTIGFTDDFYRAILANRLLTGGVITIPYQNFYSVSKSVANSDTVSFNLATQSLDMLMATFRDSGYTTRSCKRWSEDAKDTNYYKFVSGRDNRDSFYNSKTTYQFMVNNLHQPTWPATVDEARILTMNAFDISGDVTNIGQVQPDVVFQNGGFVFAQNFAHHGEGSKVISGLDTRGASSNMQFDVHDPDVLTRWSPTDTSTAGQVANAKLTCTIWAACTSTLEISAGQNVTVIF